MTHEEKRQILAATLQYLGGLAPILQDSLTRIDALRAAARMLERLDAALESEKLLAEVEARAANGFVVMPLYWHCDPDYTGPVIVRVHEKKPGA